MRKRRKVNLNSHFIKCGEGRKEILYVYVGGGEGNFHKETLMFMERPKERKFLKEILREMFKEGLKENP